MWKKNSQSISSGDNSFNLNAGGDIKIIFEDWFPRELVDQKILEEVEKIRKSRFFVEFDRVGSSLVLGSRLTERDLSRGSDEVRSRAFAWCARLLSFSKELDRAEEFLKLAKTLGDFPEIKIAEAFYISQKAGKDAALKSLTDLNTPAFCTARFMIVTNHEGDEGAIKWMNDAGYKVEDLDSDGKSFLLTHQLALHHWDDASQILTALEETDFIETPILHYSSALVKLLSTVPTDFRAVVLMQVPFEASSFPLAADAHAMQARTEAHDHFLHMVFIAKQLECPKTARLCDEYALWLELRDPEQAVYGRKRLEEQLDAPNSGLGVVHFAIQFGVKLNWATVERDIEQQVAINGGMTIDTALARLALLETKNTPEEAANYLARYHDQLVPFINSKLMRFRQIELFSRAGLTEKANSCIDQLIRQGITDEEESRLRRFIDEAEGTDPLEVLKSQYKTTKTLANLIDLVNELDVRQYWDEVCAYGFLLFEETHSLTDAERLVNAFNNSHRSAELVDFLNANHDFLKQSKNLHISYAWGLYNEGALLESRTALAELSDLSESPNYRALQVNLCIAMGDWPSLTAYVAKEYQNRQNRSAHDLLRAANLAIHLDLPYARDLISEAAMKANDDPAILANAYFLSTSAGGDNDPIVSKWLEKAAELSGDDGPIQRMHFKDIFEQKPEWDRRESETFKLLGRGEIPIFLAAQSLNRSLVEHTFIPALANQSKIDPRRRSAIPAYSGKRLPKQLDITGITVALDATALLTLSFLKILETALDAFPKVIISHSTLGWLFEERQNASFHQPSRIENAHYILNLLATDILERFKPSTVATSDLSALVGEELAALIAEAEKTQEGDNTQRIVVRSSPVHRLSHLMDEEADLSSHTSVLSSCLSVIKKLRKKGSITTEEEKKAQSYLQLQEKPWPDQPEILDGAILYLDDLTITYLQHLRLLDKLKAAGLRGVVSPKTISDAKDLISYEGISEEVKEAIKHVSIALSTRIESGHVGVGRIRFLGETGERSIQAHPTIGIIALASHCDAVIIDDRFINQHENIGDGHTEVPIFSTLDLLDALESVDIISEENKLEYRTRLRRGGYFFVPVSEGELYRFLMDCDVVNGNVVESAELKAIRESLLHVRLSDWLQLPKETPWFVATLEVFICVLKNIWGEGVDVVDSTARSNWLVDQVDVRGWAHFFGYEQGDYIVKTGRAAFLQTLLIPSSEVSQNIKNAYWSWVENKILIPLKEQYPGLYNWILEWQKILLSKMADAAQVEGEGSFDRSDRALILLGIMPPLIRNSLLDDSDFIEEYGVRAEFVVTFGESGISFHRSELFNAIREILRGAFVRKIADTTGRKWRLMSIKEAEALPRIILSRGEQTFNLPDFCALSQDSSIRLKAFEKEASEFNLPNDARQKWQNILKERSINDDEFDAFKREFFDTPTHTARVIRSEVVSRSMSLPAYIPPSRRYFERLVGKYDGSISIQNYATGISTEFFQQLSAWHPYNGFLSSLLLSSHSALTTEIGVECLSKDDLVRAFLFLENHGDRISQLGAIEIGLRILPERPEIEHLIVNLIKHIRDDDVNGDASGFKILSALFVLVDGELSKIRLFSEEPPFYRRLASLAQAALICRQLLDSNIDIDAFYEWAVNNRGEQHYLQSLVDMRTEPRWNPDFRMAAQIKADFYGRILIASQRYRMNIKAGELYELVFGNESGSLDPLYEFPMPYISRPLEGGDNSLNNLPAELSETIESQLNADEIGPKSFIALVNSALIYRVHLDQAELAAKALKLGNYRLTNIESKSQLLGILNGLATVVASTRSKPLADALRILVRRYRQDAQYTLSIEEAIKFCLVAAACHDALNEWREFIGDWLTELAFGPLVDNEGEVFHSWLMCICHAVPELWVSCGRADAALQAYNASQHSS